MLQLIIPFLPKQITNFWAFFNHVLGITYVSFRPIFSDSANCRLSGVFRAREERGVYMYGGGRWRGPPSALRFEPKPKFGNFGRRLAF